MKLHAFTSASLACFAVFWSAPSLAQTLPKSKVIDVKMLAQLHVPVSTDVVHALYVEDDRGEHVLVVGRTEGESPSNPGSGREEYVRLTAKYYDRTASGWARSWDLLDYADCPEMDVAGSFLYKHITVTDLNKDGQAEITMPYHLFCGTGVDPHELKVIMREGSAKYAIRGTSLIVFGQDRAGGEKTLDKVLNKPELSAYKQHLNKVWNRVVGIVQEH